MTQQNGSIPDKSLELNTTPIAMVDGEPPNNYADWEPQVHDDGRVYLTDGDEMVWLWSEWTLNGRRCCENILTKERLWVDEMCVMKKVETGVATERDIDAFNLLQPLALSGRPSQTEPPRQTAMEHLELFSQNIQQQAANDIALQQHQAHAAQNIAPTGHQAHAVQNIAVTGQGTALQQELQQLQQYLQQFHVQQNPQQVNELLRTLFAGTFNAFSG